MTTSAELALVLRDFFSASEHFSLSAHSQRLRKILPNIADLLHPHADEGTSWQKIEADFVRLFTSPDALAPPNAVVYLQCRYPASNAACMRACDIFYALGLGLTTKYGNGHDHLCLELDGWLSMQTLIHSEYISPAQRANLRAAQRWLVATHMRQWIPVFIGRALQQSHVTIPVQQALHALSYWLEQELADNTA